jgi:hypothetical protein
LIKYPLVLILLNNREQPDILPLLIFSFNNVGQLVFLVVVSPLPLLKLKYNRQIAHLPLLILARQHFLTHLPIPLLHKRNIRKGRARGILTKLALKPSQSLRNDHTLIMLG